MPPAILLDVQNKLDFDTSKTFCINLGNDRSNITPIVVKMTGAASNLPALDFVLDEPRSDRPFKRTIIFFNTRDLAYKACRHLQQLSTPDAKGKINFIHALRTTRAKRRVMRDFRSGEIDVLCATEAAGMVSTVAITTIISTTDDHQGNGRTCTTDHEHELQRHDTGRLGNGSESRLGHLARLGLYASEDRMRVEVRTQHGCRSIDDEGNFRRQ